MSFKIYLRFFLIFILSSSLMAQEGDSSAASSTGAPDPAQETLIDIGVVAGIGGAGAILGLSTLPFYEKPSDHMRNILMGGAIGIIVGVGLVAFNQATKSKDMYYENTKWFLPKMDEPLVSDIELNLPSSQILPVNIFVLNESTYPLINFNTSF